MYTKPRYSLKDMALWTRTDTLVFLYAGVIRGPASATA
jgi:hypothetical protein